jgi:hypothetical protein
MKDALKDFAIYLAISLACLAAAGFLSARKAKILATIRELVQKAEITVQGSKMGAEKKAMVIAELEDKGIDLDAINLKELIEMFEDGELTEELVNIDAGDETKGAKVRVYVD